MTTTDYNDLMTLCHRRLIPNDWLSNNKQSTLRITIAHTNHHKRPTIITATHDAPLAAIYTTLNQHPNTPIHEHDPRITIIPNAAPALIDQAIQEELRHSKNLYLINLTEHNHDGLHIKHTDLLNTNHYRHLINLAAKLIPIATQPTIINEPNHAGITTTKPSTNHITTATIATPTNQPLHNRTETHIKLLDYALKHIA